MINSWSLLYDELNGTMDKTYPIENDESNNEDIKITTGTGSTIYSVPESALDVEGLDLDGINFPSGSVDTSTFNVGDASSEMGADFVNFDLGIGDLGIGYTASAAIDNSYCVDNFDFDSYSAETLNLNIPDAYISTGDEVITFPDSGTQIPTPGIETDNPRKYREDDSIKALKDYICTTYNGHYTSKENNVQTLDLIESVGDAESFCRSNAIKYLSRYDKKGQAKRDILKALHYSLLLYHFSGQLNETSTRGYETF